MTLRIRLQLGEHQSRVEFDPSTTLLEVLRSAGLPARQACRNGICRLCRCRLLAGRISYRDRRPHGLDEDDRRRGLILPCIAYPLTDLVLDSLAPDPCGSGGTSPSSR